MTDHTDQTERPTLEELLDSLNGFDEIAITQSFGRYFTVLCEDATMLARAAVFTHKRREGMSDTQAKAAVMDMRLSEVNTYFPDDTEIDPDVPETPAGEDDSQPA